MAQHLPTLLLLVTVALPSAARADLLTCAKGACQPIARTQADTAGLAIIDLSDAWAPWIFAHRDEALGVKENHYRALFVGLANDRMDRHGDALLEGAENHLELYGIPPTLSTILRRWRRDRERPCLQAIDFELIASMPGKVRRTDRQRWIRRERSMRKAVARWVKKYDVEGPAGLTQHPKVGKRVRKYLAARHRVRAVKEIQKRLACEGFFSGRRKHKKGVFDKPTAKALLRFERKNAIIGKRTLEGETLAALGRGVDDGHYASLLRVLRIRVAESLGLIEDGSTPGSVDIVGANTEIVLTALGMTDATGAREQLTALAPFRPVAISGLTLRPEHGPHMELSITIDRGDVWYNFPYDEEGEKVRQPLRRLPSLSLWLHDGDEQQELIRWATTIGAWRKEMLGDGLTYLKYKNSDVGKRVLRDVRVAPTWLPPPSTPALERLVQRLVKSPPKEALPVHFRDMGPGFKSAYGLVAGYLLKERCRGAQCAYQDKGIRIHGSHDYGSIPGNSSHGCHRLDNRKAISLFGFLLKHRNHRVIGQQDKEHVRHISRLPPPEPMPEDVTCEEEELWWEGACLPRQHPDDCDKKAEVWQGGLCHDKKAWKKRAVKFDVLLSSKSYLHKLEPPVPVRVSRGRVRGKQRKPIKDFRRIPGRSYPSYAWVSEEPEAAAEESIDSTTATDPNPTGTPPVSPSTR